MRISRERWAVGCLVLPVTTGLILSTCASSDDPATPTDGDRATETTASPPETGASTTSTTLRPDLQGNPVTRPPSRRLLGEFEFEDIGSPQTLDTVQRWVDEFQLAVLLPSRELVPDVSGFVVEFLNWEVWSPWSEWLAVNLYWHSEDGPPLYRPIVEGRFGASADPCEPHHGFEPEPLSMRGQNGCRLTRPGGQYEWWSWVDGSQAFEFGVATNWIEGLSEQVILDWIEDMVLIEPAGSG